ncbi:hypothetical protein TNCT_215331 [Trichonephila clavata]|uniref:Uncharacterized protein n=1 Tax=Trichonephila clavata TaxID=2740835 RepID=A0A8X6JUE3_TRICU|nr:hypothetical protein TNCT_215331 [Trichonephila clavata]
MDRPSKQDKSCAGSGTCRKPAYGGVSPVEAVMQIESGMSKYLAFSTDGDGMLGVIAMYRSLPPSLPIFPGFQMERELLQSEVGFQNAILVVPNNISTMRGCLGCL